jgi:tryptophan-rich sensory protein
MFISFHLLETYIRNPSLFINSLFTLPPRGKHRWQPRSARAYMRVGRWVLPSFYFCQVVLPNCWSPIFLILPKLDRWQVEMPNCWSCSERNKIMYVPFHLLKNLHQESFSILYFFFTLPPRGKQRWQPRPARVYMRVGRWVLPSFYFCQVGFPNCWRPIFHVLPRLYGCQVGLPNCWNCSKVRQNDAETEKHGHFGFPRREKKSELDKRHRTYDVRPLTPRRAAAPRVQTAQ